MRHSAGLLLFRYGGGELEVLLVHPGGPFFRRKDNGYWTIPKGESEPEEDLLERAQIEFEEELGFRAAGGFLPLGQVKQKGGKIVHCWAVEGDLPPGFVLRSNQFEIEWPLRSGRWQSFPEVDRAEFFAEAVAREKINAAQVPFLDRLCDAIRRREP